MSLFWCKLGESVRENNFTLLMQVLRQFFCSQTLGAIEPKGVLPLEKGCHDIWFV